PGDDQGEADQRNQPPDSPGPSGEIPNAQQADRDEGDRRPRGNHQPQHPPRCNDKPGPHGSPLSQRATAPPSSDQPCSTGSQQPRQNSDMAAVDIAGGRDQRDDFASGQPAKLPQRFVALALIPVP